MSGHDQQQDIRRVRQEQLPNASNSNELPSNASPPRDQLKSRLSDLVTQARRAYFSKNYLKAAQIVAGALDLSPDDADLWNTHGVFLRAGGRAADAVSSFRQALARQPQNSGTWSNLGNALVDLKQLETGIVCHRHAITLEPQNVEFRRNLARALIIASRHGDAVECLNQALRIEPANMAARFDRSMAYLHLGEFAKAWPDYEARLTNSRRNLPGQRWAGEPYSGKTLIVTSEQGHGDAIWAARYFPTAKDRGGRLVVECHPGLMPVFAAIPGVDQVVATDTPLPRADLHCPVCSLPGIFTSSLAAVPPAPYLSVLSDRVSKFDTAIARAGTKLRVGVVWSGNLGFARNRDRAAPLTAFVQAFAHPEVQLFSLQKGPLEQDLGSLREGVSVIDLAPLLNDFADTAAVISQLDLVIMTDSAIAHLCGALGRPVWVLLSYEAFWLWLLDRQDSPWYPTMRLFRQRAWGDWGGAFDAASAALLQLVLARKNGFEGKRAAGLQN
jgi:tetratricopeptide (TPR) repeat protein